MWWKPPTRWKHGNLFLKNSYKYKHGRYEHMHAVWQGACSTPRLLASSCLYVFLEKYKGFLYNMIR